MSVNAKRADPTQHEQHELYCMTMAFLGTRAPVLRTGIVSRRPRNATRANRHGIVPGRPKRSKHSPARSGLRSSVDTGGLMYTGFFATRIPRTQRSSPGVPRSGSHQPRRCSNTEQTGVAPGQAVTRNRPRRRRRRHSARPTSTSRRTSRLDNGVAAGLAWSEGRPLRLVAGDGRQTHCGTRRVGAVQGRGHLLVLGYLDKEDHGRRALPVDRPARLRADHRLRR
jgi:hypothetical protein